MVKLRKKFMLNNLPALLILRNPIMFTNFTKLFMVLNKLLEHGINAWPSSLLQVVLKLVKLILLFFTKRVNWELFVCQIYVDDIIFGSTNPHFSEKFGKLMSEKFEMSMMSELKFFLGLQIKQTQDGTFVHQGKYTKDVLKKFDMGEDKPLSMPMSTSTTLDTNEYGEPVD